MYYTSIMSAELRLESQGVPHDTVSAYSELFIQNFGTGRREGMFTGISGRILRGTTPENFTTLTDDPTRKVVYMLDNMGLNNLIGLNGRDALLNIGYPEYKIDDYLSKGTKFKVVVFPETSVHLANWDNLLKVVSTAYPEWAKKIMHSYNHLKMLSYEDVMKVGGEVTEVRKFLFDSLNVNELYIGDGTTPNGQKEYITINKRIDSFESFNLIDFPVI